MNLLVWLWLHKVVLYLNIYEVSLKNLIRWAILSCLLIYRWHWEILHLVYLLSTSRLRYDIFFVLFSYIVHCNTELFVLLISYVLSICAKLRLIVLQIINCDSSGMLHYLLLGRSLLIEGPFTFLIEDLVSIHFTLAL